MAHPYAAKLSPEAREALRQQLLSRIPSWYRQVWHLIFPSLVGLFLVGCGIGLVHDLRPAELLLVPAIFLLSNATEWRLHRDTLHHRQRFVEVLYDRHTPMHHRLFITEDMAIRSPNEFRLVLIPAYGIILLFLGTFPLALLLYLLHQRNLAGLFIISTMGYSLMYEWLHLSYHLPEDSFIGRCFLIRLLRHHHATHHNPALMQKWNFNVTIPLWDLVRGTYFRAGL